MSKDRGQVIFFENGAVLWVTEIREIPGGFSGEVMNGGWYLVYQDGVVRAHDWRDPDGDPVTQEASTITHQVPVESGSGRDYNEVINWAKAKIQKGNLDV